MFNLILASMKRVLLIVFFYSPFFTFSQVEDWYGVDLSRIGYKHNSYVFEQQLFGYGVVSGNQSANDYQVRSFDPITIKGGSFELSADVYSKHVLFNIDASSLLDVGVTLFQFKDKERWWDNKDYRVDYSDILPVRLAFGTNISPYFSLYVGGQYSLNTIGLRYKNNNSLYSDLRMGGHAYGVGGHAVAAYKFLNFRYSYMYDWTSFGGHFKGNRIQNEWVLSVGISRIGVFCKYKHSFSTSNEGNLPEERKGLFKSSYEDAKFKWQNAQFATKSELSVGIYLTGLFSAVSNASTRLVGETEIGVAKERREEKRRRIKWVE